MKLKEIKRTGWLYKDIPNPESVSDHSFGVALLALVVPLPNGINREKALKMALVHDIGEARIGDIVWESGKYSNIRKQKEKHISETATVENLFNEIGNESLKKLAIEFLEQKSETAIFIKELDKLEMVIQALEYEKKVHPSKLDEFWENARKYIKDKKLKEYFDHLSTNRSG